MEMERQKSNLKWGKTFDQAVSLVFACAVIVVLFISSFDLTLYTGLDVYQKEYEKYEVLDDLDMTMEDVMHVTEEMMEYLRGNRETLSVITRVEGLEQDFFNGQDRFHMEEVKDLFLGGLRIRNFALFTAVLCFILLLVRKADLKKILPRAYYCSLGMFSVPVVLLGIAAMINFDAVFVKFHEIFFDNDLWIFDPEHDFMIRMLPEGLFYDMTFKIGGLFLGFLIILLVLSVIADRMINHREKHG